ncbi:tRNA (guanine-N(7)-)-methyltransferase non-catalytic subunit wdr4 [Latimeria chalumnae]|uniref:tRNA (guanine-N(7)-)-methyltransferase non-catalytic subunit wdr4 n=1 Tax=Latimeria chalumnae TaxID=7897 RepID=UPI00313E360E
MAALRFSRDWLVISSGSKFLAHSCGDKSDNQKPFVYDCSTAVKEPAPEEKGNDGHVNSKGSDRILAFTFSPSGKYFALIDDSKRLVLFRTEPSWECLSVRCLVRRCTSLAITHAEGQILAADKSGDVYSFSILEAEKAGELRLGHLSMLLDVALSPDDKYVLTADRDEKIRVSSLRSPYDIESFCLGHREFVSTILVLPNHPNLLLSGSGDGTLRLWEYKSGREVLCCELTAFLEPESAGSEKKCTVTRITHCTQGDYIAVLCSSLPVVHILQLDSQSLQLTHKQKILLEHRGWDISYAEPSSLWVLQEDKKEAALLYRLSGGQWQRVTEDPAPKKLNHLLRDHWGMLEESVGLESPYDSLYKVTFDNMGDYLRNKEVRLQQRKRKGEQPLASRETKKLKRQENSSNV